MTRPLAQTSQDRRATGQAGRKAGRQTLLRLQSPAFANEAAIPAKYTCDGSNISPPLTWAGVPQPARALALIVDDPDAPDPAAPQRTFTHWVVYEIPTTCSTLAEAVTDLPEGAREGLNDWSELGYQGPCPPKGRHRYRFKLYALDMELADLEQPTKEELEKSMRGHVLAEAVLIGTYEKQH